MKNYQDKPSALPALLRAARGVDTLEPNSLYCAAADIIAPSSATAEALIPHEKLRGAALADATLNAQERPLAQPVVGYKQLRSVARELHGYQNIRSNADLLGAMAKYSCAPHPVHIGLGEEPGHNCGLFQGTTHSHERFDHIRQREIDRVNSPHSHQMFFGLCEHLNSLGYIGLMQRIEIYEQHMADFGGSPGNTADKSKYNFISLPASSGGISRLSVPNIKSRAYSRDTSESLNPRCSTLPRPTSENQRDYYSKTKGSRRRQEHFAHRTGVELDLSGPHKWLPATTQKRSLITFATAVHEHKSLAHSFFSHRYPSQLPTSCNGREVAV
ncbi:hypothetical protein [Pseudomonas fluorescens]|uniref:hypothetical protein n=1 Tax=Pseudomonas fluorescens TaxID=294 RepID=UPI00202397DC|nr:hypothetical protein [Pseudomonas fluorescens]